MARRRTAGLLILKDGEIALERYGMHGQHILAVRHTLTSLGREHR